MDSSTNKHKPITWPIVGIGSSAGGLEALTAMIGAIEIGSDCSFVVIQHLSPHYRSMLVQLLGRDTPLAVQEVKNGETPVPDVIYVAPANHNVQIRDGIFHLLDPPEKVVPKPSVDMFFRSLADELGDMAVGVILSGTGSDGAVGVKAIKAAGGTVLVQTPETAKYDGMPRSAIDTGAVDMVLPPKEIANRILSLAVLPEIHAAGAEGDAASDLEILFTLVRRQVGIDFRGYKSTTIERRIQRRMAVTHSESVTEYVAYAQANEKELDNLTREILISVTSFFRDRDAFLALGKAVDAVLEEKLSGEEIRAWVPGCATGEEAYSIAMMFLDRMAQKGLSNRLVVYATDIDVNALATARRGVYSITALSEVPSELADAFFVARSSDCEVSKDLRDTVVFARQDLILDPPFMHMDLISCRNVLIYFQQETQAKVLSILFHALKTRGFLFLGRSESVAQQSDLFIPVIGKWRLFQPKGGKHKSLASALLRDQIDKKSAPQPTPTAPRREERIRTLFQQAAIEHYVPAAVLVDGKLNLLHASGDLETILRFPDGQPRMILTNIVREEFRTDVQVLIHNAQKKGKSVRGRGKRIDKGRAKVSMRVVVHPLPGAHAEDYFLVCFEIVTPGARDRGQGAADEPVQISNGELENELTATREHLQTLNQELETSNEEMQALTEEIQASNEELQATNEELEASNEELQATNEELVSLNQEMIRKSAELSAVNVDFENVNNSLTFPLIVLDRHLAIKRLNQAASLQLGLSFAVRGQQLDVLGLPGPLQALPEAARAVMDTRTGREVALALWDRHYDVLVSPCISAEDSLTGVIIAMVDNTDLHNAQQSVSDSHARMTEVMNHSTFMFTVKDTQGRYEFVNRRFTHWIGLSEDAILGHTDHDILPARIADHLRNGDLEVLQKRKTLEKEDEYEHRGLRKRFRTVRFPLISDALGVHALCTQAEDITERRQAEEQLRLAAKVFHRAGEGISITDADSRIITVNDAFTTVTGYSREEVVGRSPAVLKSGRHSPEFYEEMWAAIKRDGWWQGEIWNRRKNGEVYPEWLTVNAVKDEHGVITNYVGIFSDITVIKSSQRRIEYLATHDDLTNLPNRSLFTDRVKHAIARAKRTHTNIVVMFIDLDNFKVINDTMGHDVGDLLLKEASTRLLDCVREEDTVARLGGDEFTVLLEDTDYTMASVIAERIIDQLGTPFGIHGRELFVSASIGMSVFPTDGEDSQTLLKNADTAMYRAKDQGKNQYCSFTQEMKVVAQQRLTLETGLRQAIPRGDFRMVYQPQIDLRSGRITGAEALVRWTLPDIGVVSPVKFIPIAEQTGLIVGLTEWICRTVFEHVAQWLGTGLNVPRIYINMSGQHFKKGKVDEMMRVLIERHGLEPSRIGIELTESSLMENSEHVVKALLDLKSHGFGISIDDFGTGYSSLSYLKRYPIKAIKIDRSFVDGIADDPDDKAIADAIISMAHSLGMRVIAEGVETEQQLAELKKMDCDAAQGFLFHQPLSAEDFEALLNETEAKLAAT